MKIPDSLQLFYLLGLDRDERLYFTDCVFKPHAELMQEYWDFLHPGLVEFAFSGRRDCWLLFDEWGGAEPLVLFYGIGAEATVFARTFREFLLRRTIEEYTSTWLFEDRSELEAADQLLRGYPDILRPVIGDASAMFLTDLLRDRVLTMDNYDECPGYLSESEMEIALAETVGFELLGLKVEVDTTSDNYNGIRKPETLEW